MSEARMLRVASAVIFFVAAVVLLFGREAIAAEVPMATVLSWLLLVVTVLLAIALLPLRDATDFSIHKIQTTIGFFVLMIWVAINRPEPARMIWIIGLATAIGLVWRSTAREGWRDKDKSEETARGSRTARLTVAGIIVAIMLASFFYRWLVWHRLEQTSALFIGIPALLAIIVVNLSRPTSATGLILKATAVALLVSGTLLGEGFVCVLMASPLFFLVALLVGGVTDWARKRDERSRTTMSCLLLLAFVPMSFEGTRAGLSFPREEMVRREILVAETPETIAGHLAATPRFPSELPAFLRLGFPQPVAASGSGLHVGDRRTIHFAGGEGKPGDLVMEVAAADGNSVEFREISDTSHVAHWLKWESTRFEWTATPRGETRVVCTVRYRRLLDPAWYFKPWERYAVGVSADYLLRSMTSMPAIETR